MWSEMSEAKTEGKEEWRSSKTRPIPIGPTPISPNILNNIEEISATTTTNTNSTTVGSVPSSLSSPSSTSFKKIEDVDGKLLLTSDSTKPSPVRNGSLTTTTVVASTNSKSNKESLLNSKEVSVLKRDDACVGNDKKESNSVESSSSTTSPAIPRTTTTTTTDSTKNNLKTLSTKISRNGKESVPVGIAVAYPRLVISSDSNNSNTDTMSCSPGKKSIKITPTTTTTTTPNNINSPTLTKVKNASPLLLPKRPLSASSAPGAIPTKERVGGGGGVGVVVGGGDKQNKLLGQNIKVSDQKNRPASVNSIPIHHHGSPTLQPHWTSFIKQPYSSYSGLTNQYTDWPPTASHGYDSAAAVYMHQQHLQQLHLSNVRNNNSNPYGNSPLTHSGYAVYGYSPETIQKYEQYLQQSELHRHQQELQQQYHHQLQQHHHHQQQMQEYVNDIRRASTPIPSPRINIPSPSPTHSLWPPEFFHQNSSMALSPKSLTSTPSPIQDTSHYLLNPSSKSRCATPTINMINTAVSSSSNINNNNSNPSNGTNTTAPVTAPNTTTTTTTSVNSFPYCPANFPNWKEVKIVPAPKKLTKKYNGESDDSSSMLDVLKIEEDVRRENNTTIHSNIINSHNNNNNNNSNSNKKTITLDGKKNDFSRLESLIEKRDQVSVPLLNPFPDKYFDMNDKSAIMATTTTNNNNTLDKPPTSYNVNSSINSVKVNTKDKMGDPVTTNIIKKEKQVEIKNEFNNNQSCDVEVDGVNQHDVPDAKTHLSLPLKQSKLLTPPITPVAVTATTTDSNINSSTIFSSAATTTTTSTTTPKNAIKTDNNVVKIEGKNTTLSSSASSSSSQKKTSTTQNMKKDKLSSQPTQGVENVVENDIIKKERSLNMPITKLIPPSKHERRGSGDSKQLLMNPSEAKKCIYDNSVDMKSASDKDSVTNYTNNNNNTCNNNDYYNKNRDIMLKSCSRTATATTHVNPIDNNNVMKISNVKEEVEPIGHEKSVNSIYYGSNVSMYNKTQVLQQQQHHHHEKSDIPVKVVNPPMEKYSISFTTPTTAMNIKKETHQPLQQQQQSSTPLLQFTYASHQPLSSTTTLPVKLSSEMDKTNKNNLESFSENVLFSTKQQYQNLQPAIGSSNSLGTKCDNDIIRVKTATGKGSWSTSSNSSSYSANSDNSSLILNPDKEEKFRQLGDYNESQRTILDVYYRHHLNDNNNLQQQQQQLYPTVTQETGNRNQSYHNQLLNVPLPPLSSVVVDSSGQLNLKAESEQRNHHHNQLYLLAAVAQEFGNDIGSGLMKKSTMSTTTTNNNNTATPHPSSSLSVADVDTYEFVEEVQEKIESFGQSQLALNTRPGNKLNNHTHTKSISSSSSSSSPIPISSPQYLTSFSIPASPPRSPTTVPPVVLKIPHPQKSDGKDKTKSQRGKTNKKAEESASPGKGKGKKKATGTEKAVEAAPAAKKRRKSSTSITFEDDNKLVADEKVDNNNTKVKRKSSPKRPKIPKQKNNNYNNHTLMTEGKTVDKIVIINTSKNNKNNNTESKEHKVIMPLNLDNRKSTSEEIVMKKGNRSSLGSNLLLQNQSKKDKPIELVLSQQMQKLQNKSDDGNNAFEGGENPSSIVLTTQSKKNVKKLMSAKSDEPFVGKGGLNDEERQSDKPIKKKKPSQKLNARSQDLNSRKSKDKKIPVNTFNLNTNNKKNKNNINSLINSSNITNIYNNNNSLGSKLIDNNVNSKAYGQLQNNYEQPLQKVVAAAESILYKDDDDNIVDFNTKVGDESQIFSPSSSNGENDWVTNPTYAVTAIKTTGNDESQKSSLSSSSSSSSFSAALSIYKDDDEKSHMSPNKKDRRKSKESQSEYNQTKTTTTTISLKLKDNEQELVNQTKSQLQRSFGNTSPRKNKQNGHSDSHHPIKPCLKAEPILRTSPEVDDLSDDDESRNIAEIENIDILSKSPRRISSQTTNTSPRRVCLQNDDDDDEDNDDQLSYNNSYSSHRSSIFQQSKNNVPFATSTNTTTTTTSSSSTFITKASTGKVVGTETTIGKNASDGSPKETTKSVVTEEKNEQQDNTAHEKVSIESVAEMINDMRILTEIQGLFYTGKLLIIAAPDVYGVTLDNERGQPPHFIFSREEVLEKCIREVKPPSLTTGLRICAYWSPQYSGLYPGKVSVDYMPSDDPQNDLIPIEFDDGDTGVIKLNEIRLLPPHHPVSEYDPNPLLTLEKKHRKRRHSSATGSQSGCSGDHEDDDCGESYCVKVGKFEEEKEKRSSRLLYWTWKGLGYKKPRSKKDRNKEFFDGIQRGDEIINVGDSALFISNGNERPFIGRVERFWEKKGQKVVHVRWFYHPEEVKTNSRKLQGLKYAGALFESPHIDENDVQTIAKKCEVLPFAEFKEKVGCLTKWPSKNNNASSSLQDNICYYIAGWYDPYNYKLQLNDLK